MPNRIIREGILTSERIDMLDASAEVFYRRLMSKVDDHGLYDARMSVLRSSLYPLRVDRVREADISRWIAACEKAGLIALYQHDGKPYLRMLDTRWQARSEPKYPLPTEANGICRQAPENSCAQLKTTAPVFVVVDVDETVDGGAPSGAGLFDEFWKAWPKHEGKALALKAFEKLKPNAALLTVMLKAIEARRNTESWLKDGGKFIPLPATWINGRRWEDELVASGVQVSPITVPSKAADETARYLAAKAAESAQAVSGPEAVARLVGIRAKLVGAV